MLVTAFNVFQPCVMHSEGKEKILYKSFLCLFIKKFYAYKNFLVLDSGMENVIVTRSISGVLLYGVSHRRKDKAGNQKTDALYNLYSVSHSIKPQVQLTVCLF